VYLIDKRTFFSRWYATYPAKPQELWMQEMSRSPSKYLGGKID